MHIWFCLRVALYGYSFPLTSSHPLVPSSPVPCPLSRLEEKDSRNLIALVIGYIVFRNITHRHTIDESQFIELYLKK